MHIVLTTNVSFVAANFRAGLIRRLISDGHAVTVMAAPDVADEQLTKDPHAATARLTEMGCNFVPISLSRNGTNPMSELKTIWSIYRCLRRLRPDFVFSYTVKNNIYAGLACRALGIRYVPNVTGIGPAFSKRGPLNLLVRVLYRVALRKSVKVFFQNSDDLDVFLGANLVAHDRVSLLPGSGVDLEAFAPSPLPDKAQPVRFLLIARMLADKGIRQFAEAARQVKAKHPSAQFHLMGPFDVASRTAMQRSEIDKWVSEGIVSYDGVESDIRPAIGNAHCIVLPSFYREGTPRSLLEAGAMGRPLITTDMPGCRDTVIDGVSGYLVTPKQTSDLVRAMLAFLALAPDARSAMGHASREHIAARYDEQVVISAYTQLLD